MTLKIGRIKHVQHSFGFLTDEEGIDRFFHRTDIQPAGGIADFADQDLTHLLIPGLAVSFLPVMHAVKGPRALQVCLLSSTPGLHPPALSS